MGFQIGAGSIAPSAAANQRANCTVNTCPWRVHLYFSERFVLSHKNTDSSIILTNESTDRFCFSSVGPPSYHFDFTRLTEIPFIFYHIIKTPPDRVIYIPELTARSINSRNKFLVMKPSSKASSAVK